MRKIPAALILLAFAGKAWSVPTISTMTGTFSGDANDTSANVITISGSGFGTKSPAPPIVWATFENGAGTAPTVLGTKFGWNEFQHAISSQTSPYNGSNVLASSPTWINDSSAFAVRVDPAVGGGGYGQTIFTRNVRRTNFIGDRTNEKWWRYFDALGGGSSEDIVTSNECSAGTWRVTVEPQAADFYFTVKPPAQDLEWHIEQHFLKTNSALNAADGVFRVYKDSQTSVANGMQTDTTGNAADYSNGSLYIQADSANNLGTECDVFFATEAPTFFLDDIYVDKSWKRIYVATSSVLSTATVTEMMIPKTWAADDTITAYFHQGRLPSGRGWVFVCDGSSNNLTDCSAGKEFTIGATAADTSSPTITNVATSAVTSSGITVTWDTDEGADSQIEYGLTDSYGNTTTLDGTLVTSHSQSISGLSASTEYHYRVRSADSGGLVSFSSDGVFNTSAAAQAASGANTGFSGNGRISGNGRLQ